jgi:DNA-binding SARP family transcriptional activator
MAQRPHPRSELAEMLFGDARDPLGALRWNLAELRRLLGLSDALKGDSLALHTPSDTWIDARALDGGDPEVLDRPGFEQELLAGLSFPDSPVFETWLLSARRRLARRSMSLLREAALGQLARGAHDPAIGYATRLVAVDPLDEGHHALLIRAHGLAGDPDAAGRQFERCRETLRAELGVAPGAAVLAARAAAELRSASSGAGGPEVGQARLAVAWQSFLGGAVDHAIDLGRGAVSWAEASGDPADGLLPRMFLAAMLGMAVRGWDEAASAMSQALSLTERLARPVEGATALGVLAGTHLMRADYDVAVKLATRGLALSDDPGARAANLMFLGAAVADQGSPEHAAEHSRAAVSAAEVSGDPVLIVYSSAHAARVALMCGDTTGARLPIERAMAGAAGMPALRPWPMAMLAEVEIVAGRLDAATRLASEAAALAATTNIAYQRALACRAAGLAEAARGNTDAAVELMTEALSHARRSTGEGYPLHWTVAFILESLSTITEATDPRASRRWAHALLEHATAGGMLAHAARARRRIDGA